jgi:hypothetical protein
MNATVSHTLRGAQPSETNNRSNFKWDAPLLSGGCPRKKNLKKRLAGETRNDFAGRVAQADDLLPIFR